MITLRDFDKIVNRIIKEYNEFDNREHWELIEDRFLLDWTEYPGCLEIDFRTKLNDRSGWELVNKWMETNRGKFSIKKPEVYGDYDIQCIQMSWPQNTLHE